MVNINTMRACDEKPSAEFCRPHCNEKMLHITPLCSAFKAFIKPFEAPQRSVKKKFTLIFSLRPGLGQEQLNRTSPGTQLMYKKKK